LSQWDHIVWMNEAARVTWEPRIRRIKAAWGQVERASVAEGVREACVQSALPEGLAALAEWAAVQGLVALPLGPERRPFADAGLATHLRAGKRWNDRVVITRSTLASAWMRAWRSGDDAAIARWLGFPSCCGVFFQRVCAFGDGLDTSWWMAENAVTVDRTSRRVDSPAVECNVLLRWLGVRLIPHLPCSFTCVPSVRLGEALARVALRYGHGHELDWAREILSWPAEWSAIGGTAEIKTSAFRIATPTDSLPGRYTICLRAARRARQARSGLGAATRGRS